MVLPVTIVISKITEHTTITNVTTMKFFKLLEKLPECETDREWASGVGNMTQIDLLDTGLPQTFIM